MLDNKIESQIKRDSKIRKEVSNKVFLPVVNAVNHRGLRFKDFLSGVPYEESYLLNKRERVEWWVYCRILKNMRSNFSESDFEKIGADFLRTGPFIDGLIGFFLFTSKNLPKTLADKILERITSHILCLKMQIEFVGSNKIRFILKLDEGYEHVSEFAYGNKGIIKELGIRTGLKDCKVDLQFMPQGGIYEMTWKKGSVLFRIKRVILWLFSINKAFWELTDTNEELLKEYEKLEEYKNTLEIKVDERTAELKKARDELTNTIKLLQEMQTFQNRFFTNISHEFRTPLTLILGPVKQIIDRTKEDKTRDDLKVVHKNANRILVLVNQLLDISKLESGSMKLHTSPQNIIPLIKALLQSFCSYAERKRISLKFNSDYDEVIVYLDKDKIEKILTNVLSNALKFTPEGGLVEVTVASPKSPPKEGTFQTEADPDIDCDKNTLFPRKNCSQVVSQGEGMSQSTSFVKITIRDTGIGIPKEKIPKIFNRFYQVDGSVTREQQGTGIGLSLTKELVELHKGKIKVESEEGKGSTFTISIPLGKEHLKPEEICETSFFQTFSKKEDFSEEIIETKTGKYDIDLITETNLSTDLSTDKAGKADKPFLLLVEDNSDVRNYIKNNLHKAYRILEAVDGEDGWNKSIDSTTDGPDLIVSDVMMPKMDGFKLCNKIKTDERTSHIPVILLTAKATSQNKIEGFEMGADDYIMKPFDTEELKARIKNLIDQRKRIHEHFKKHGLFEIEGKNLTPIDQKFLYKAVEIINEHLSDTSFGVEVLAEKMMISRSLLLKKIGALIGESPNGFIKRTRLKKAAMLIENKFGNISEVALEVGFNNPSYFAECFKKQFGVSPSQFH